MGGAGATVVGTTVVGAADVDGSGPGAADVDGSGAGATDVDGSGAGVVGVVGTGVVVEAAAVPIPEPVHIAAVAANSRPSERRRAVPSERPFERRRPVPPRALLRSTTPPSGPGSPRRRRPAAHCTPFADTR